MLRSLSVFVALISFAGTADAQPTPTAWTRVYDRHGSSFELPSSADRQKADRGDLVYTAERGRVRIAFSTITEARPGFPGNDPAGDMNLKRADCTTWPPSYHEVKAHLAAYSCVRGNAVAYYVARYEPWGSVTLQVAYPRSEDQVWAPAVRRMSGSMRQVRRREAP